MWLGGACLPESRTGLTIEVSLVSLNLKFKGVGYHA